MEYPWKEVVITETPVFKDHKLLITETDGNCTIRVIECIRNEPDVCMSEYFVHILWTNVSKAVYNEELLGPYHTPALKSLLRLFGKAFEAWENISFNR